VCRRAHSDLERKSTIIADKAYDADWIRAQIRAQGAKANIPNTASRTRRRYRWQKQLYRQRNVIERFFNKLKQYRRIATRYDKLGAALLSSN
jgi:transposase